MQTKLCENSSKTSKNVIVNKGFKLLFTDDTEIHSSNTNIDYVANNIKRGLLSIRIQLAENEVVMHPGKSEVLKIGSCPALKNAKYLPAFRYT